MISVDDAVRCVGKVSRRDEVPGLAEILNNRKKETLDMRKFLLVVLLMMLMTGVGFAEPLPPIPTPGMVTMVEVGANRCIPCKMMAPIIAELKKEYAGTVSILFLDVWENQEAVGFARKAGVRGIPTQIYYDRQGKEISRHVGYMDKPSIVAILTKLGAKPTAPRQKK